MARPTKQGVDYFPLDIHLDDKFKFIEIKYKLEGFAILIKLLQKIYSYGYWYNWTEDEIMIFADENRTSLELVKNVVDEAITREIFDSNLYQKYSILTSKGIQKRYKEIVRRRKDVAVTTEYLLIDDTFGVNDDINPTPSKHNDDKSTQSKVKNSKEDNTKEDKKAIKKEDIYILSDNENKFINILLEIENYPLDRKKDLEMYKTLEERYPTLNLIEAIEQWRIYKLDQPLKVKSNPRSQINTAFKKYVEWGKCIKSGGTSNGINRGQSKQNGDQYAGIGFSYEDLQDL